MEKRYNDIDGHASKKQKIDNDMDDVWGEDLNIEDIDKCILLETQVMEDKDIKYIDFNDSILPSYSNFKPSQSNGFTSTQTPSMFPPPTPKVNSHQTSPSIHSLESKVTELQQKLQTKQGEVSILQSQIKQLKSNRDSERHKIQQECSDKINATIREMNSCKTDLEFKNLEIANLKQKVSELSKNITFENSQFYPKTPQTKTVLFKSKKINEEVDSKPKCIVTNYSLNSSNSTIYPLKNIPTALFQEIYTAATESTNYYVKRRDNLTLVSDEVKNLFPRTLVNGIKLDITFLTQDIIHIIRLSADEINSFENYPTINKIVCVSHQLVNNFFIYVKSLENLIQPEDIQKEDALYLENKLNYTFSKNDVFGCSELCENEIGIPCRRLLAFIAELLPFSKHLQKYLLCNAYSIEFSPSDDYVRQLPALDFNSKENTCVDNFKFLNLLYSLCQSLGQTRKSNKTPGILLTITSIITKICVTKYFEGVSLIVLKILKEIIFSRPPTQVLDGISKFLEKSSKHFFFVKNICLMASMKGLKTVEKQGIIYFNQDSCVFQVFCTLYEKKMLIHEEKNILSHINILLFAIHVFGSGAEWLYYQENNHCECLLRLTKLCVGILYKCLNCFTQDANKDSSSELYINMRTLFHHGVQALSLINSICYDLIQRSIATYSEYKSVIIGLLKMQDIFQLDNFQIECLKGMNVIEDMPTTKTIALNHVLLLCHAKY